MRVLRPVIGQVLGRGKELWGRYGDVPYAIYLALYPVLSLLAVLAFFLLSGQGREFLLELVAYLRGEESAFTAFQAGAFVIALVVWLAAIWYATHLAVNDAAMHELAANAHPAAVLPRRLFTCGLIGLAFAFALAIGWVDDNLITYQFFLLLPLPAIYYLVFRWPKGRCPEYRLLIPLGVVVFVFWMGAVFGPDAFVSRDIWPVWAYIGGYVLAGFVFKSRALQALILAFMVGVTTYFGPGRLPEVVVFVTAAIIARSVGYLARRFESRGLATVSNRVAIYTTAGVLGLVLLFAIRPVGPARLVGAPAIVLLACAGWAVLGSYLFVAVWRNRGLAPVPWLPMALALIFSPFNDNHALRNVSSFHSGPRDTIRDRLTAWKGSRAGHDNDQNPLFVVAASGGGLRAAYWTARYLAELDDRTCGAFGERVFAISGVSGGSLGAATFVTLRKVLARKGRVVDDPACVAQPPDNRPPLMARAVEEFLDYDYLSPPLASFLFPDTLQRFLPFIYDWGDRGLALERAWEDRWRSQFGSDEFGAPFVDLYKDPAQWTPLLFFNMTRVEDGRRIIAAPIAFAPNDAYLLFEDGLHVNGLRLSAAVHNSARFTYLSPPASYFGDRTSSLEFYPGQSKFRRGRIVDGGYFENSGVATAQEIIAALQRAEADNLYVIVIENDPQTQSPDCSNPDATLLKPGMMVGTPVLFETTSPIVALLNSRSARGTLHERRILANMGCHVVQAFLGDVSLSRLEHRFVGDPELPKGELRAEPALGWYLAGGSVRYMNAAAALLARQFPFDYHAHKCASFCAKRQ